MSREQAEHLKSSGRMRDWMEILKLAQEKYSNGETTLQMLDDYPMEKNFG